MMVYSGDIHQLCRQRTGFPTLPFMGIWSNHTFFRGSPSPLLRQLSCIYWFFTMPPQGKTEQTIAINAIQRMSGLLDLNHFI